MKDTRAIIVFCVLIMYMKMNHNKEAFKTPFGGKL